MGEGECRAGVLPGSLGAAAHLGDGVGIGLGRIGFCKILRVFAENGRLIGKPVVDQPSVHLAVGSNGKTPSFLDGFCVFIEPGNNHNHLLIWGEVVYIVDLLSQLYIQFSFFE
ncbi:MAG: hypothetical protein JWQ66_1329 [Mucilaginibacter sp.]|nr:hypothetical protein [Mucilaginibacter sp.]